MKRRPWFNALALFAGAALLAVLVLAHVRFHSARSRLPEAGSMRAQIPGLEAEVEVLLDSRGIPFVRAANEHDLWMTQGYLHARERFFQMDLARRVSSGRLAELLGEAALPLDRKARIWQLGATARRQAAMLDEGEREILEAYAAGVNAALTRYGRWIAPEEWLLLRDPDPWTVEDTLYVVTTLQFNLSWAMGEEIDHAVKLSRLGEERAVDLWGWTQEQRQRWIPPIEQSTEPIREEEAISPRYDGIGSNAWVLASDKTATGRPLLANDPHVAVIIPGFCYLIDLEAPGVRLAGASIAGTPMIQMGHNQHVAWGLTMVLMDDQDLFRLTLDPSGTQELIDGSWQPLRTVSERINVRFREEPVLQKVQISERGPIVRQSNRETLALSWTGYRGPSGVKSLLRVSRARSVTDLAAAWEGVAGPAMNMIAADVDGKILHQVTGLVPDRGNGTGYLPAPGDDSRWAWRGLLPYGSNPRTITDTGFLANANHDIFGEGEYPESQRFSGHFYPPWRVRRVRERLESRDDWDAAGCLELQADLFSTRARAALFMLREELQAHSGASAQALLEWDGQISPESLSPHIYARLILELSQQIAGDEAELNGLAESPFRQPQILRILGGGLDDSWWDDLQTNEIETRTDIIARALDRVDELNLQAPWGEVHRVKYQHPFAEVPVLGRLLDRAWSRGPFEVGGDAQTVASYYPSDLHPFAVTAMPAMRFVTDVGSWDNTLVLLPLGQSGRPWSAHYDDQIRAWARNQAHTMPFSRQAIERAARARLQLLPVKSHGE
jgi:penicillin amidase